MDWRLVLLSLFLLVPTARAADLSGSGGGGGLASVESDTAPKLGGSLDVNGNIITSSSDGDIILFPDGTGQTVIIGPAVVLGSATVTVNLRVGGTGSFGAIHSSGTFTASSGTFNNGIISKGGGANSVKIGDGAQADGPGSIAIGHDAQIPNPAATTGSIAIGDTILVQGAFDVGIGFDSTFAAGHNNRVGIGHNQDIQNGDIVAIGAEITARNAGVTVVGFGGQSLFANTTVLGRRAKATKANQFVAGSELSLMTDVYFGKGPGSATPTDYTIHGTSGTGTNIAGAGINFAGGQGTGTGIGGSLTFLTSPAGSSGASANALVERMRIDENGEMTIAKSDADSETGKPALTLTNGGWVSEDKPFGLIYISTENATATTSLVENTLQKAAGTSTFDVAVSTHFAVVGDNRLVYRGVGTARVFCEVDASISGTANDIVMMQLVLNGSADHGLAKIISRRLGSGSGEVGASTTHDAYLMSNGDFVELFIGNESATSDITVASMILSCGVQ